MSETDLVHLPPRNKVDLNLFNLIVKLQFVVSNMRKLFSQLNTIIKKIYQTKSEDFILKLFTLKFIFFFFVYSQELKTFLTPESIPE